jgi:hypothetical protein
LREIIDLMPRITVDFRESVSVHNYLETVSCIVRFFAFSMGRDSRPNDVVIAPFRSNELAREFKARGYAEFFDAHNMWSDTSAEFRSYLTSTVFRVDSEAERAVTKDCLIAWLSRRDKWRDAYVHMMDVLQSAEDFGPRRILNACRWFESIPYDEKSKDFTSSQLDKLKKAVFDEAEKLGLREKSNRLRGVVSELERESFSERSYRLLSALRDQFGPDLVPTELEQDCKLAKTLRGDAAHGRLERKRLSFSARARAIYAMEWVSFLLTIRELPISKNEISRLFDHPLNNYRLALAYPTSDRAND